MAVFVKKLYLIGLVLLLFVLVGCGEDNAAAPAPTPIATAVNNNAPPTATALAPAQPGGPTAAVATPGPTATANPDQSDNITRVPVLPTTMPADPNVSRTVLGSLPAIKGAKEINTNLEAVNVQIRNLGLPGAVSKVYFSDDQPATVINNAEVILAGAGYRPNGNRAQPGKPGFYAKVGNPDISLNASALDSAQLSKTTLPGLTQAENQQVAAQLKGHKSLLLLIVAPNMTH